MKGLLIKDFCLIRKSCTLFLLMILAFLFISVVAPQKNFFYLYDAIFMGMISHSLLTFEERDGSDKFYLICPVSKKQIVTEKYILSAIFLAVYLTAVAVIEIIKGTELSVIALILSLVVSVGVVFPSLSMPIIFRYGYAKGKIVFVCLGALIGMCGAFLVNTTQFFSDVMAYALNGFLPLILIAGAILIFVLSCLISVKLYQKREF